MPQVVAVVDEAAGVAAVGVVAADERTAAWRLGAGALDSR
jgi:hypothetical protein